MATRRNVTLIGPNRDNAGARGWTPGINAGPLPSPPTMDNELTRTPLQLLFPDTKTLSTSVRQLAIPAGTVIGANEAGWFGLIDVEVGRDIGQQFGLYGITWTAASLDVTPAAGFSAWGNLDGSGVAIIVGTNLPSVRGSWISSAAFVAGFGGLNDVQQDVGRYFFSGTFPPGNYSAATGPFKTTSHKHFSPYVNRIPSGARIQAALVVDGAAVNAAAGGNPIRGFLHLQLNVGLTRTIAQWNAQW